ncbi:MAG: DNA endonuclease SmrA [Gammaproteobacteria bacterium]|nr:DNA endonuclease SmrA [Gammaproteobacteria bacterium]MBQ0775695.1 DNA endonuclease SmrA [Gammaproteobacteria bacterium]
MTDTDKDLFLSEMSGVKRLPESDRIDGHANARAKRPAISASVERRRLAALGALQTDNPLTDPEHIGQVGPLDIVGHRKNGVQEGVYRKLRLGKYEIGAKLDLHRIKIKEARMLVQQFLQNASDNSLRTVLITHGKGIHSPTPGLMKSYVMHWLAESNLVLAWHSAQAQHGATGATYILIKQSGAARQETTEHFNQER